MFLCSAFFLKKLTEVSRKVVLPFCKMTEVSRKLFGLSVK